MTVSGSFHWNSSEESGKWVDTTKKSEPWALEKRLELKWMMDNDICFFELFKCPNTALILIL